ncbi:26S proteasome non-ATPase regulatory subunit 11 [Phytophthora palmivora]|uniref:26S proteasome non-ATPase regulatory subunit 11 n=1 Tax=Phytophthora palmivora TaxID=4796 RepID=A0A2P4XSW0_9STRA|nr:26S proteasome non-ATPase regulatory subunit 11 [Phytophthora palmivora]
MQTKVQKIMFERWGETLVMDFTHGTNNLGYHLGSLVVTTCTGRGFPVVDFICLNEQATTISTILEYFKEKNTLWENVVSVVIDKDFTEWKVLEECFPKAKILLCQFHAFSYWKKIMKRSIYGIKLSQGEELLGLMIKLLYSRYVNASTEFYRVKAKAKSWVEDRKWLERNWSKLDSDVDFFAKETQTWGVTRETVRKRHQTLANEVISKFTNCRLRSAFSTRCDKVTIPFEELVGSVCRGWLSDSSIEFCLSEIAASARGCCVVSSLLWQIGWPASPRDQLGDYKFVVHPVNLSGSHWGIIIIQLEFSGGQLHVLPHMYEPLIDDCYHEEMETIWNGDKREGLRGFIDRWHQASSPGSKMNVDPVTWVDAPQQPDNSSCGVLVVAHAHSVVAGNADLHCYNVSKTDIDVMRLRMLWLMLLGSRERRMPKVDASKAAEIDQKLQDQLK